MTAQPVKVKTWQIQVRNLCRGIERIKHQKCPFLEIRSDPAASTLFEKLAQALVFPGPYHIFNVNSALSFVNYWLTIWLDGGGLRGSIVDSALKRFHLLG